MKDAVYRQDVIDVLEKILPADPMHSEYTQGITCGAALGIEYVKQLPPAGPDLTQLKKIDEAYDRGYEAGYLQAKNEYESERRISNDQ